MSVLSYRIPNSMTADFFPANTLHSFEVKRGQSANTFYIKGWSTGSRVYMIYSTLLTTLDSIRPGEKVTIRFDYDTFDSTSVKFIFKIIKKLNALMSMGCAIEATWIANVEDGEMIETGIDFEEFCDFKFQYQMK